MDVLRLVHTRDDGACVQVASWRAGISGRYIEQAAIRDLASRVAAPGEGTGAALSKMNKDAWQATTMPVDGQPVEFRVLNAGDEQVALALIGEVYVMVSSSHASDLDSTRLVRVEDTRSYTAVGD